MAIGASAGGLEAIQDFFKYLPPLDSTAFVVIQHLSPDFKSLMDQLLSNFTKLKIKTVENNMPLESKTIYLIPPKNNMMVLDGVLFLMMQERNHTLNLPIDIFFKSMAKEFLTKSIAVILSGTGSDGSQGILEVGAAGGLVIVQNPETSKFNGMPINAINTQVVNKILNANQIPVFISEYLKNPITQTLDTSIQDFNKNEDTYEQIFSFLNKQYKVDFRDYKEGTINRRINRRATTLLIESIEEYAQKLFTDESEGVLLYNDLLIGVTSFFRDPEAYQLLETEYIPNLFAQKLESQKIRVWVAGCSTGEEAYSLAILLKEYSEKLKKAFDIKIFASDISQNSLNTAAQGCFNEAAMYNVSKERKERFFIKKGDHYFIIPEIRNFIMFAPMNLLINPPFTKIDMISCRNLLIYIRPKAQKMIINSFHYALNKDGLLFLGPSEGPSGLESYFKEENQLWKIYKKTGENTVHLSANLNHPPIALPNFERKDSSFKNNSALSLNRQQTYDLLLEKYLNNSVIIDSDQKIIHVTGEAGLFLNLLPGKMSTEIINLILLDLRPTLTNSLRISRMEQREIINKNCIVKIGENSFDVDFSVNPFLSKSDNIAGFVLRFDNLEQKIKEQNPPIIREADHISTQVVSDLENQIQVMRENLNTSFEEAETVNEELQSTNEELLASNEELQSTNEELHSVNEELYTVNSEHQNKIAQLESLEEDIDNLVHSTGVGTILLDENLCIRRITPAISKSYNILPHDLGRSIMTFAAHFKNEDFLSKIKEVQMFKKTEILDSVDNFGRSILIKMIACAGNRKNKGIIISFTDMTELKETESKLIATTKQLEASSKDFSDLVNLTAQDLSQILQDIEAEVKSLKCPEHGTPPTNCQIPKLTGRLEKTTRLINSLNIFSELNKENIKFEKVDLDHLIKTIIDDFTSKHSDLSFSCEGKLPTILCDKKIIYIIFERLIENGINFNDKKQKKIQITSINKNNEYVFSVTDNGIGFLENRPDSLFKLFNLSQSKDSKYHRGYGIGLAITKRGVDLHKGKIWYESELEVGSVFCFSIPDRV